jgi:FkbM family methyltransferase
VAHLLNKNGWTGQILTFEPDPGNRAFINENLRSNSLESQIRLIPFAVSDTTGLKRMIMSDEDNSANTLVFDEGINYGKQYQVVEMQTVRLDDFYQDLENVSAIKMDIQGGEYWALLGAERIISEFHPVLILEVVESWGKNISEIEKFLSDHDYEVFGLDRKSKLCKLRSKDVYVSWDWIAIPRTRLNSFKDCIAAN